jgi:hypothetical protein
MPPLIRGAPLVVGGRRFRSRTPVYLFVEGETEEDYIRYLGQNASEFQIFIEERHTDRKRLVEHALALRSDEVRKSADPRNPDEYPRVWCVFDYDGDVRVDSLFRKAARYGVRIAFSHPCLELWWLLHFQAVTASLDTETIKTKLGHLGQTDAFRGLSKNKRLTPARWSALQGLYLTARGNAERLVASCACACSPPAHREDCVPSGRSPSCNMANLVDSLRVSY